MKPPPPEPFVGGPSELRARARALKTAGPQPDFGTYDHKTSDANPVRINKNRTPNSDQLGHRAKP